MEIAKQAGIKNIAIDTAHLFILYKSNPKIISGLSSVSCLGKIRYMPKLSLALAAEKINLNAILNEGNHKNKNYNNLQ